jgi:hypothetical protein
VHKRTSFVLLHKDSDSLVELATESRKPVVSLEFEQQDFNKKNKVIDSSNPNFSWLWPWLT